MDLSFQGRRARLDDIDLPRIAARIGCGEDHLHAFMDVEAAGSPFDGQGRPKMLFEPHVFWRELGPGPKRDAAAKAGLAYPRWGQKSYPRDSYPRLLKAVAIDETAALRSASWGLTQILGSNHKEAGYKTPQAMVTAFMDDAETHIEATVKLLSTWGIADDLKAHRWDVVAKRWNGPGYKKNRYDTKMAAAYAKWRKIKDTPFAPNVAPAPPERPQRPNPDAITDKVTVEVVQRKLKALNYQVGGIDGVIGTMTKEAILAFRMDNGLPLVPVIDQAMLSALDDAKPRELAGEREQADDATVRDKVPEVRTSWLTKIAAFIVGIPAAIAGAFDGVLGNIGAAKDYVAPVQEFAGDVPGWVWLLIVAAIAGGIFVVSRHGEQKGIDAFRNGARR